MLDYKITKDEQYDELLELIYQQETTYLKPTLDLVQMTEEQFGHYFRTSGRVYRICSAGSLAGFCWVEEQGKILYLRGLVLKDQFQGQGIGTWVLTMLESIYGNRMEAIELKVHESNPKAKALYERCGYETVCFVENDGFYMMRKNLRLFNLIDR